MLIPTRSRQPAAEAPSRPRESASPSIPATVRPADGAASGTTGRAAPAPPIDDVTAKLERVITRLAPVASNAGPGPAGGEGVSLGEDVGLSMALAAGPVNVSKSAPIPPASRAPLAVDAGAPFNAVDPAQRPRFEAGQRVVAGSFLLNGKRIEVLGDDSISSVLQRMGENLPELAATFADDRVRLSLRSRMRKPIAVGQDSSGFVAATGLGAALAELGAGLANARRAEQAYGGEGQAAPDPWLRPGRSR